ncbi:MAG TPA: hypothetical protein VFH97_07650, partial [Gemmatimonadales bacterium]|nr:hypothetical protein [Gemmatimonadales bacterium]
SALIARKAAVQSALGTPQSSAVGRAAIPGGALDRRERFLQDPIEAVAGYAVVPGDGAGPVAVVRLRGRGGDAFRLLTPPATMDGLEAVARLMGIVDPPGGTPAPSTAWLTARLRELVAASAAAPGNLAARQLGRRVVSLARIAARTRDLESLNHLDRALQLLLSGVSVGAERELSDALSRLDAGKVSEWCDRWASRHPDLGAPEVVAVVARMAAGRSSGYIRVNDPSRACESESSGCATG